MAGTKEKISDLLRENAELVAHVEALLQRIKDLQARKNNDLDSIEFGAPTKGGRVKIYLDTKAMATEGQGQIDAAADAMKYLMKKMEVGE